MDIYRGPSYDIISNLPTHVKETILTHLSLRDAVRTSILSKAWRYCWTNLPRLVFDSNLWQELRVGQPLLTKNQFVFIIYQIVLLHQGPILEFILRVSSLGNCFEIDQLILFLSRKNIEKFVLDVGDQYTLPSSFFTCLKLKFLGIRSCVFNPPASFNGFSQLTKVKLFKVTLTAEILESFISSSPLLKSLTLTTYSTVDYFYVHALRLTHLLIRGHLKSIVFKNAPLLSEVSIGLYSTVSADNTEELGMSNFSEMFICLPRLKKLELDYSVIQLLAAHNVWKNLPTTSVNLTILKLDGICLARLDELSFVICLIKGSPKLQNVEIEMYNNSATVPSSVLEFLEEQDYLDVSWDHLQLVTIQLLSSLQPELEFIKLLLAKSPKLEKLLIKYKPDKFPDKGLKMLKDLLRFERTSPKAQIIFEDHIPS